ncbi:MAG: hypothetical protein IJN37_09805 [Clostridia bacterium]|nr:hypothetical protein [Clostridia bacterium]
MALNPKTNVYTQRASAIYKENIKIIFLLAALTAVLEIVFDALGNNSDGIVGLIIMIVRIIVTAPLLICTYHVYTRAINGKSTSADFVFTWLTNISRIKNGAEAEIRITIKAIGWYIVYAVIVVFSAFLGPLSFIGIAGGFIFLTYMLLRYNGALYECAANPDCDVKQMVEFGIDKLKVCMGEYVNLWLASALPAILIITVLEMFLAQSWIVHIIRILSFIVIDLFILPRFHIAGIMLYNDGYMVPVTQAREDFEM